MIRSFVTGLIAASTLGAVFLTTSGTAALADADEAIKYRKVIIGTMGRSAVALADIIKGKLEQGDNFAAIAEQMAHAAELAPDAFKTNTVGKGKEKTTVEGDKIWANWSDFSERMETLQAATRKVADLAAAGDRDAAKDALFGEVFKTCKGCHDTYRQ
ncbi:MAG: cytochrome c [Pseudomonadota bacterium]